MLTQYALLACWEQTHCQVCFHRDINPCQNCQQPISQRLYQTHSLSFFFFKLTHTNIGHVHPRQEDQIGHAYNYLELGNIDSNLKYLSFSLHI